MPSHEDFYSDSEFYYLEENCPGTTVWIFNPNANEILGHRKYIESQTPESKTKNIKYDLNIITGYLIHEKRSIQTIPAVEINTYYSHNFFVL